MTIDTPTSPTRPRPRRGRPPATPDGSPACAVATAAAPSRSDCSYVCPACFGPLEVDLRLAVAGRDPDPRGDRAPGARASGATLELLPVEAPPARVAAGRLDAAARRRPPGADPRHRAAVAQGRHPQPVALASRIEPSRSPRPRRRRSACEALACASTGNLAGATAAAAAAIGLPAYVFIPADLEPAKVDHALAYGATVVPIDGTLRRRQPAVPRGRRRDRLGLRQHQPPARSTPRARRPSPSRSPRRSAGARRTSSSRRSPRARCSPGVARGFEELAELGLIERRPIRFVGGQAAGCAPVATAFGRRHRRHRAGPRAGHDRPLAGDRQPGRRPLRASSSRATRAARSRPSRTT